ncbi:unnamed protein product [Sphagnum troendelagicum]
MKFGKILAGVVEKAPPEYLGKFLSYKLLKRHIFLHKMGACQCALARQIEGEIELRRPLASGAGASHCHECNRPIYAIEHDGKFTSSVHDGGDNGPRAEDHLQSQVLEFKRLLRIQLWKINVFFTATRQFCYFTMTELNNMRLNEEARQNILHPSGRRYWSHDTLLRIRQRMFSLSAMMALLGNYSYLNFAAFIKILKKHDKRTGSNIRAEFVQHILLQEDSFVFTEELNHYASICLSLLDRFPEPHTARRRAAAGTTFLIRARGGPLLVPAPTVADSGEEPVNDTSDCESSTETRPNLLRRRPLVRSPYARPAWSPAECVYMRAATAAVAAGIMVSTTVGSTHNCHSMYPPNV